MAEVGRYLFHGIGLIGEANRSLSRIAICTYIPLGALAVVGFLEKGQQRGIGLVNAGIYVFQHDILDRIPDGCPVSLETDIFPRLIGQRFYGMHCTGYFVDIGVPEAYLDLQADPSRLRAATPEGEGVPC
jgi:NDP-sugar pyrophosphorylase family protein